MFYRIIDGILLQRKLIIVLLSLMTLSSLWLVALRLEIDNSLSIWFLETNPQYQEYIQFQEEYGSDEVIIVMLPRKDIFSENEMQELIDLHQMIDTIDYVATTFSLANAKYPIYSNRKIIYRNIYRADRPRENIENLLAQLPAIKHQLLSDDEKFAFFYIQLQSTDKIENIRDKAVRALKTMILKKQQQAYISGSPILNEAYNQTAYQESNFFAILTVVVIFVLLFFLLPQLDYLPIAFLALIVPVSILLAILTLAGYKLNLISMLIPTILMVYSVSDAIHIINFYHENRKTYPEKNKIQQIKAALQHSLQPCFYTTLTTLIGYSALYLSPLPAFKTMGLFCFIGLVLAFFLVYVIAAIGLYYHRETATHRVQLLKQKFRFNLAPLLEQLNILTTRYNRWVLILCSLILVTGIALLPYLEVNTKSINLLGPGKVKSDLHQIEQILDGSARLHLAISRTDQQSMLGRVDIEKVKTFQNQLVENPLLVNPISLATFTEFLQDKVSPFAVFNTKSINLQEAFTKRNNQPNDFISLVSEDASELGIIINIRELKTKEMERLLQSIRDHFTRLFPEADYRLKIQGFSALFVELNKFILQTQFRSFAAAFILAFCILFYFIGDFKISLLALIPNLLPLSLAFLVMVVLGIPLEASNVMLAPIMLGVAMDDTIHLLHKFKDFKQEGYSTTESMNLATLYTGSALLNTSIALVCGFLIVGWSGVVSISTFGLLCAFTVGAALFADLIFLPALVKRFG